MARPLFVDFFSCSGLWADGLAAAGWDVVCVDNDPKALKHNPHHTVLGDALTLMADKGFMSQFDAAGGSPPCQGHSATRKLADAQGRGAGRAVNLIPQTRTLLRASGLPFVIENVERSPLREDPAHIRLCGSAFNLPIQRHRLFVSEGFSLSGTTCDHSRFPIDPINGKRRPWGVYYTTGDRIPSGGRTVLDAAQGHEVMGVTERTVPWKYLCEALPPVYGEYLGAQMLEQLASEPHRTA